MRGKPTPGDLLENLGCSLCRGFLVDAVTLSECLHFFCHSCLLGHLEKERRCPKCANEVSRESGAFHRDRVLQDFVYKAVPSMLRDELRKRNEFARPSNRLETFDRHLLQTAARVCSSDENISLLIQYEQRAAACRQPLFQRYFRCLPAVTIGHLKKLLRNKLLLTGSYDVHFRHENVPLDDSTTLMDIVYMFGWRRKSPMKLLFGLRRTAEERAPQLDAEEMPELMREISPRPPLITASAGTAVSSGEEAPSTSIPVSPLFNVTLSNQFDPMNPLRTPIITVNPTPNVAPRKRRKPSSPLKKPASPVQRMTGAPPIAKAPLPPKLPLNTAAKSPPKICSPPPKTSPVEAPPIIEKSMGTLWSTQTTTAQRPEPPPLPPIAVPKEEVKSFSMDTLFPPNRASSFHMPTLSVTKLRD